MSLVLDSQVACPCQSGQTFGQCCAPFITGEQIPETPGQLMRSRYTAYTQANMDYLEQTTQPSMRTRYDFDDLKKWAQDSEWLGLKIYEESHEEDSGRVCFTARYRQQSSIFNHSEDSQFILEEGRWYFVHGKEYTPPAEKSPGRNDPCLCGSGKKYKKCCMNK